jgi:sugar phosphate isomerase/epimerase
MSQKTEMGRFRVGIDNHGLYPLRLGPLDTLQWAKNHGADGVQFSGLEPGAQKVEDQSYLRELAAFARDNGLYLEWGGAQHIPRDTGSWAKKELLESNRRVAQQAMTLGTRIVRSCSGGLMRWRPDSPMTETLLQESAQALLRQKQMLLDHNVVLAIETHFEFTSFELARLLEMCQAHPGEWLGICLDTMNLLIMLEDPVSATRRLLPWVVCTHVKDGGILLNPEGLTSFPVPMGKGVIDFPAILRLLKSVSIDMPLSIEDHGGSFLSPIFDPVFLSKFPDLTAEELSRLIRLSQKTADRSSSGCRATERDQWPDVCEQRLTDDIVALKEIASSNP